MTNDELLQVIEQAANDGVVDLDLSGNSLTELPPEIGQLTSLQSLVLSYNQLSALPTEIVQLTSLQSLVLSANPLSALPTEIVQLTSLQSLDLSVNELSALPPEIGQLTSLQSLVLSSNQLSVLPTEIGQLTSLQSLDLSYNQLSALPTEIGQLTSLQSLVLSSNQLRALPTEIGQLTKLKTLDLRGNDLPIPPEILGDSSLLFGEPSSPQTIFDYLAQLWGDEKQPLNEAKVLVMGQGKVGKTSLVNRLLFDTFNPHEQKTEGIDIKNWNIVVNDQTVQLNIWDFGGQEIMHATHQFFLIKRSLYLLVLDARLDEANNRLDYWLKIIQSFGGNSPIIIVGNQADEHPLDIDRRGLQQKYPNIHGFVETSCRDGTGIDTLKTILIKEIGKLDHVFDLLPKPWFIIKTRLEELKEQNTDYIPYHEYQALCQTEEICNMDTQSNLITLLHQLGIVLNFRGDERVQDTNVLNPEWVTNGVYRILNYNRLMTEFKGVLKRRLLNDILDRTIYPRDKHQFIINNDGKI
ncbi:MAG: COR domain-containing protein [Cyanobacteria bacterium P01_E01_bin.6]